MTIFRSCYCNSGSINKNTPKEIHSLRQTKQCPDFHHLLPHQQHSNRRPRLCAARRRWSCLTAWRAHLIMRRNALPSCPLSATAFSKRKWENFLWPNKKIISPEHLLLNSKDWSFPSNLLWTSLNPEVSIQETQCMQFSSLHSKVLSLFFHENLSAFTPDFSFVWGVDISWFRIQMKII